MARHSLAAGGSTASLLDWQCVEDHLSGLDALSNGREAQFLLFAVYHVLRFPLADCVAGLTDGGNDRGIDAVLIDRHERVVHLFSAKCAKKFESSRKNFPGSEIDKIIGFVDDLIYKNKDALRAANPALVLKMKEIWDLSDTGKISINVHLVSNMNALVAHERERLTSALRRRGDINLIENHLHEIARALPHNSQHSPPKKLELNAEPPVGQLNASGIRILFGFCTAAALYRFLVGVDGEIDKSLFNANLRGYLGKSSEINKDIRKTLHSESRFMFPALNNGIKISCEQLLTSPGSLPVHLKDPQIINGGQTARELFDFYKQMPQFGEDVIVKIELVETRLPELRDRIALATNSQQRISPRDLRANDLVQTKITLALRQRGYIYLAKRDIDDRVSSGNTIDSLRMAQLLAAYHLELPERAKTSNELFSEMYYDLFDEKWISVEKLIWLDSLYRELDEMRGAAKSLLRTVSGRKFDEKWVIEGVFHVIFAVKILSKSEGESLFQSLPRMSIIERAIDIVGGCFEKQTGVSAYRFFRSARTKDLIRDAIKSDGNADLELKGQLKLI